MDDFMAKPCTRAKLVGALERIEMARQGQREGQGEGEEPMFGEGSFRPFVEM